MSVVLEETSLTGQRVSLIDQCKQVQPYDPILQLHAAFDVGCGEWTLKIPV